MDDSLRWSRYFRALMIAHLTVWTAVCWFTRPNAPLDTVEMAFWGRHWMWGYYKHPPLPAWITSTLLENGGLGLVYFVAQIGTAVCMWAVWRLGREMVSAKLAFVAAALLECSHYYTFMNTEVNNNIVRPFWALCVLFLYWAIQTHQLRWWLACGVSLGLGMLCKYDIAILGATMLAFGILVPAARPAWRTAGPYAMIASFLVVFAAHAVWMAEHDFVTIQYAINRSSNNHRWIDHFVCPLKFLRDQFWAVAPGLFVAWPLLGWRWQYRNAAAGEQFSRQFVATMVFVPIVIIVAGSALGGLHIRSMWGSALWSYFGLALMLFFKITSQAWAWRRTAVAWVSVASLMVGTATVLNIATPYLAGTPSRIHFPGKELANSIDRLWHARFATAVPMVAGPWWIAGNYAVYGSENAQIYGDLNAKVSPWASDKKLRDLGGVVVWQEGCDKLPRDFLVRFPNARRLPTMEIPYRTAATIEPLRVGAYLVPPAGVHSDTEIADRPRELLPQAIARVSGFVFTDFSDWAVMLAVAFFHFCRPCILSKLRRSNR